MRQRLVTLTRKSLFIACYFFLILSSSVAGAVTWNISNPDVSPWINNHTNSGPVSYVLTYTEEVPPLELLDDPGFFQVVDEDDNPVNAIILVRAINSVSREIRIESIEGEGLYRLLVDAGTAQDGNGFAIAGEGNPFVVDKTEPSALLEGPFAADLVTPLSVLELSDSAYYIADFSVEHLAEPARSLAEADLFSIAPAEGVWQAVDMDFFSFSDEQFSADVQSFRTGDEVVIRLQSIDGPEMDMGIQLISGAAADFAGNISPYIYSALTPLNDDLGPEISIEAPSPALSNGAPVSFDVVYSNANVVTLSEDDISVSSTGDLEADLDVDVINAALARVTFSNFSGEGSIRFSIAPGTAEDFSGDLAAAAGPSDPAQIDTVGPIVVFGQPTPLSTVSGPASIPFTLVGAVSVSLLPSDIIVNTTGDVSFDSVNLVNTGVDSRRVDFTGLSGEGALSINIPANVAIDQYFQDSLASEESPSIQVGPLPPMSLSIGPPNPGHTVNGPVSYSLTYGGVVSISLGVGDISLQTSGTANAVSIAVSGSGSSRIITLDNISGEGAIAVVIAAGTAHDAGGNPIAGIVGNAFAVGTNDIDGDLVPDGQEEFIDNTDKNDPTDYLDSDSDGVPDFVETFLDMSDPDDASDYLDSDGGLTPDYVELYRLPLPMNAFDESDDQLDSDGDGLPDYLEFRLRIAGENYGEDDADLPVTNGDLDEDADGIENGLEHYLGELLLRSDPGFYDDFDRDGYFDHHEVKMGLDPRFAALDKDADADGIHDRVEAAAGFDLSASSDRDADGIPDFIELVYDRSRVNAVDSPAIYVSNLLPGNPLVDGSTDTDGDGLADLDELAQGFAPQAGDQPALWLRASQGEGSSPVCEVAVGAGLLELRAMIGNRQSNISSISWANSSLDILALAIIDHDRLWLDPATLAPGQYSIAFEAERVHNAIPLISHYSQVLRVVEQNEIREDLDEDGICDDFEASSASVAQRNRAPLTDGGLLAETGLFFRLGDLLAFSEAAQVMQVAYSLVAEQGVQLAPAESDIVDSAFGNLIPRLHFKLYNLPAAGSSASVIFDYVTEQGDGLAAGSEYRLLTEEGWQTFFEGANDGLESAPQTCDASPVFDSGLRTGARCIRLIIQDGGLNDLDGETNGVISHLGAPALEGAAPVDDPDPDDDKQADEDDKEDPFADFVPGKQTIAVGEAGSFSPLTLLLMLCLPVLSFFGTCRIAPGKAGLLGIIFFLGLPASLWAEETPESPEASLWWRSTLDALPLPALDKFYLGAALGQSFLDADFSNLYALTDDQDLGFKVWLDYQLLPSWMLELEYAVLGESMVQGSDAAIATNVFPAQFSEAMRYRHTSMNLVYEYPLPYQPWSVIAKGGLAYADIQSDLDIEVVDRVSPAFGLGLQYYLQGKYVARLEYETFSKDSSLLSIGIAMRLAEPRQQAEPLDEKEAETAMPEEVPPEESEEALAEAPVEEQASAEEALEQLVELQEETEPAVNMEEMFSDLKRSLEPSSLFEKGSATLSRRLMGNLDEIIYFLDSYPEVHLIITGHASDEGHEYLNENLSRLRAHGAKTYLQANRIDASRITVRGRGEHFPAFGEQDEDYRIRNRRIEYDFYIPRNKQTQ